MAEISHYVVVDGDSWTLIGAKLVPGLTGQPLLDLALKLAVMNGGDFSMPLHTGRVLMVDVAALPKVTPTDATDSDGATGATGVSGSTGVTGSTDVTGSTGPTDVTGTTGTTDVTGATGATGATGSTDVTGSTGSTDITGATGATGTTGATGPVPLLDTKLRPVAGKLLLGVSDGAGGYAGYKTITGKYPQIAHDYATGASSFKMCLDKVPVGCIPLVNFKPAGMGRAAYTAILNGDADATIDAAAGHAKTYRKKFFVAPMHEPENNDPIGSDDALYAQAWRYVWSRFKLAGVTNVVWVWNVMSFRQHIARYNTLYPGDDCVDWIAGDPYWHVAADSLYDFGSTDEFYAWAAPHGKPIMYAEWGIDQTICATAAPKLNAANLARLLQDKPLVQALVYWNQWLPEAKQVGDRRKDYRLSNFPSVWRTFAALPQFAWNVPFYIAKS